eukprot:TRINITY_DN59_c0_g1_i1.p1 TRINITY_DN59_c0_g1~~TRINITY_DN59_c0_g1_i1.p1  ORF type:complete len:311 (-),score=83.73 TRINITY_DN59_c0_g1_i1:97-1029(-)
MHHHHHHHHHENPVAEQALNEEKSASHKLLDLGAKLLQDRSPIKSIHQHLVGVHFYNGEPTRQVIAHHFCAHLNDDFHQCVIYDSDKPDAKLIGIEYVISAKLFHSLPEEEKKYWHSHYFEVKGAVLRAPGLPQLAETPVMTHLANTYGKTFHTWDTSKDSLPYGPPSLMMSFTADNQIQKPLLDQLYESSSTTYSDTRSVREKIEAPPKSPDADQWETGKVYQLQLQRLEGELRGFHHHLNENPADPREPVVGDHLRGTEEKVVSSSDALDRRLVKPAEGVHVHHPQIDDQFTKATSISSPHPHSSEKL